MTESVPHYATLVVFGKEGTRSVTSPDTFREIVTSLTSFVGVTSHTLKSRGYIVDAQDRNVAPRRGILSSNKVDDWIQALGSGTFMTMELFDGAWSDTHFPAVYANLHRLWGPYTPSGYAERAGNGAENCVTVAFRKDLLMFMQMKAMESYARTIVDMLSGFYGYVEHDVEWDQEVIKGLRENAINHRTRQTARDYRGTYRMDDMIPRLYWGNILSRAHFKGGSPDALPAWAVARLETWRDNLFYVRFVRDPQADPELRQALEPYFNLIPS